MTFKTIGLGNRKISGLVLFALVGATVLLPDR